MTIFGSLHIDERAVQTHRDSYLLDHLTVASVRRPALGPALIFALGLGGFGVAFADLLYAAELRSIALGCAAMLGAGFWLGQLKLLSRDLRGSELSGAVWGSYRRLNVERRRIAAAMRGAGSGRSL